MYRGQQINKLCCAKSIKDASAILNVNYYFIKTYGHINKIEKPFNGVMAYFDSGNLWNKEKKLIRKVMPLEELIFLIDKHKNATN